MYELQTAYKPPQYRLLEEAAKQQELQQVRSRVEEFQREQEQRKKYHTDLKSTLAREYDRQIEKRRLKEQEERVRLQQFESQSVEKARKELDYERTCRLTRRKQGNEEYNRYIDQKAQSGQANPELRYQDHQFFKDSDIFARRRSLLQADTVEYLKRQIREKETDQMQRTRLYPVIAMDTVSKQERLRQAQQREREDRRLQQRRYDEVLGKQVDEKFRRIYSNQGLARSLA